MATSGSFLDQQRLSINKVNSPIWCTRSCSFFWRQKKFEKKSKKIFTEFFSSKKSLFFSHFFQKIDDKTKVYISFVDLNYILIICRVFCIYWHTPQSAKMLPRWTRKTTKVPTRVKIPKIGHNSRDDGRTIFWVRYSESACKNEPSCKFSSLLAKVDFFVKIFVRTSMKIRKLQREPFCKFSSLLAEVDFFSLFFIEVSTKILTKKSTSSKKDENLQEGSFLHADSEYRTQKIVRPSSRELWPIFVILK